MSADEYLHIIDCSRLTDAEVDELLAGLADWQRRKDLTLSMRVVGGWMATAGGIVFLAAAIWAVSQLWIR